MTANGWERRLARLRRELDDELEGLWPLVALERRSLELEDLLDDLDRQLARVSAAAVVVLVGATGAGKSTLLNALAGAEIAREGESRPTTSTPTVFAPLDADLSELLAGLDVQPKVVRYDPERALLGGQVLIDAPDTNSVAVEHHATVRAMADRADVLVAVLHRQSVVEEKNVEFLRDFAGRRELVVVLGRADELTERATAELLEQAREVARAKLEVDSVDAFALSARAAREGHGGEGFERFLDRLRDLLRAGRMERVRRHNAIGVAGRIAALVAKVRAETAEDLTSLPDEVAAATRGLAEDVLEEVEARLDLRRSELSSLLAGEAGRRWDGPVGWALRAGTWSTVSAGLGLALARRNPLAAAGVAVGGAAVGKAREATGRRRLEDADTLCPESGDVAERYAQHFGPVRVRAGRLCGEPERLGVPGREQLERDLTEGVAEAWSRLMHRGLPEAAERAAPVWLRWALDLPIYAFAGWLLYRAGEGFLAGDYVGLDFLINGLLLGLAFAFMARLVVRGTLGWRARRLVADVRDHTRLAADRTIEAAAELVSEEVGRSRAALDSIAELDRRWRTALDERSAGD
ncbi:dynamin family protein [Engelhardtia mirabilis]|uniref:GTPase Era n=1 Tax=Engelhardtia mirabilis TaxID=2528011 RepID=A0A518BNE3_9BACT|nr:GTPase Era [Planctomycetes bacterium Pla133]QDV02802.1 GTPase Era [Planctomycetes bacterium Pla86]